jgi:hypothetical protein
MTNEAYNIIHMVLVQAVQDATRGVEKLKTTGFDDMTENEFKARQIIINRKHKACQALDLFEELCGR